MSCGIYARLDVVLVKANDFNESRYNDFDYLNVCLLVSQVIEHKSLT